MVKRCGNCGKEIQDNRNFETHIQRCMFNRTKTLVCDRCNRRYSYRSSMYLHKRHCEGLGENEYEDGASKEPDGSRQLSKGKLRTRFPCRMIKPHQTSAHVVDVRQSSQNFKYVMCLRTKTIHLVNENEVETESGTELNRDIETALLHTPSMGTECNDIIKSNDHNDYEMNEYIVEEVPLDCDHNGNSDDEDVVVLEDFGFFNKVEVRNSAVKLELNDPLEEFEDC